MSKQTKTNAELIKERSSLKQRIRELEQSESEHKRTEKDLRDSETKYRFLAESAADVVFTLDINLVTTYVSPSIERMLGFTPEERIAQKVDQQLTLNSQKLAFEALVAELDQEKEKGADPNRSQTLELEYYHKDGSIKHLVTYIRSIRNSEGRLTGFYGSNHDITERKQAEEALQASEKLFRSYLEYAPDGVYMSDLEGNFLYGNSKCEEITGYRRNELIGKNFLELDLLSENSLNKAVQLLQANIEGKSTGPDEIELISKEGRRIPVEINTSVVQRMGQGIVLAFVRDITERKRAEESLRESEEKYRNILENMNDSYFETDMQGNMTFFNPMVPKTLGYSPEEMAEITQRVYLDPESAEIVEKNFRDIYRENIPSKVISYKVIRKDRTKAHIETSFSLIKNKDGHSIGYRGISRDITDRKLAEEELRESEEKYRNILENIEDGYFEVDLAGNFTFFNPSICRILGYPGEEIPGMNNRVFMDPENAKKVFRTFNEVYVTGTSPKGFEWEIIKKDGAIRHLEVSVSLIANPGEKPTGFRGIARDVTDRKLAEEELQRTLESLRKAVGVTIQVIGSAVELRDPYTAGHQLRVADLARAIATEMGLPHEKIEGIRVAGSIHDIGKLSIPAEILSKPTKLSELEFSLIKEHARSGFEMLKDVESPWPLAQIVYQHHERMDGSGYPRHLKGDEIIMEARILALADTVESMASRRPYRPALGIEAALEEIEKNRGTHYDNAVADACMSLFRGKGYQFGET